MKQLGESAAKTSLAVSNLSATMDSRLTALEKKMEEQKVALEKQIGEQTAKLESKLDQILGFLNK